MYWHSQAFRLLKMETVYSVRTLGANYPTAQYYIPKELWAQPHCHDNLKPCTS